MWAGLTQSSTAVRDSSDETLTNGVQELKRGNKKEHFAFELESKIECATPFASTDSFPHPKIRFRHLLRGTGGGNIATGGDRVGEFHLTYKGSRSKRTFCNRIGTSNTQK